MEGGLKAPNADVAGGLPCGHADWVRLGHDVSNPEELLEGLYNAKLSNACIALIKPRSSVLDALDELTVASKIDGSMAIRATKFCDPPTVPPAAGWAPPGGWPSAEDDPVAVKQEAARKAKAKRDAKAAAVAAAKAAGAGSADVPGAGKGAGTRAAPRRRTGAQLAAHRAQRASWDAGPVAFSVHRRPGVVETAPRTVSVTRVQMVLARHREMLETVGDGPSWGVESIQLCPRGTVVGPIPTPQALHLSRDWTSLVKLEANNALTPDRAKAVENTAARKAEARASKSAFKFDQDMESISFRGLGTFIRCGCCQQYQRVSVHGGAVGPVAAHGCAPDTTPLERDVLSDAVRFALKACPFHRQGAVVSQMDSLGPDQQATLLADAARLGVHLPGQGWGLAVRGAKYSMPAAVQKLLSEYFEEGAMEGSRGKVSPSTAKLRLSRALPAVSLIGLTAEIIASYFGRRFSGDVGPFSMTAAADDDGAEGDGEEDAEEAAARPVKRVRVRKSTGGGGGDGGGGGGGVGGTTVEVGTTVAVMFTDPEGVYFGQVLKVQSINGKKKDSVQLGSPQSRGCCLNVAWYESPGDAQAGAEGAGALYTVGDDASMIEVANVLMVVGVERVSKKKVRVVRADFAAAMELAGAFEEEEGEEEEEDDDDAADEEEDDEEGSD
jgi:hypothetical protein